MLLCSGLGREQVSLRLLSESCEREGKRETDGLEYLIEECAILCYFDSFPFALLSLELLRIWSGCDAAPFDPVLQRNRQWRYRSSWTERLTMFRQPRVSGEVKSRFAFSFLFPPSLRKWPTRIQCSGWSSSLVMATDSVSRLAANPIPVQSRPDHSFRLRTAGFFQSPTNYTSTATSLTTTGEQQSFQLGAMLKALYANATSPNLIQGLNIGLIDSKQYTSISDGGGEGGTLNPRISALSLPFSPTFPCWNFVVANLDSIPDAPPYNQLHP